MEECEHKHINTQRFKDLIYELDNGRDFYVTIYIEYCSDCGQVISIHQ